MVIRFVFVIVSQSLCTFISAGSKLAQLQCLWRSKDSRQVSTLTWALATYTCLGKWHERKTKHFSSLLYWHWVFALFVSTDLYHRHHHRRHTRSVRASWRDVNWTEVLIVIFIFLLFLLQFSYGLSSWAFWTCGSQSQSSTTNLRQWNRIKRILSA